jgi:DNA-binding transcriptional LysR family regulator
MSSEIFSLDSAPPLDSLTALLAFVQTGGVAAAAESLDLPQPTISRRLQIFQRRDAAGEAILVRQGRNLRLSEKGQAALPAIRELVAHYAQLESFLKGARSAVEVVRIGTGQFGARHYLPRALAELRRKQIVYEVRAEVVRGQERILGVVDGRLDLALVTHDPRQIQMIVSGSKNRRAKLQIEALATHTFCVMARVGAPLASELRALPVNRPAPLALLSGSEFVGLDRQSGIRLQLEAEFQKAGLPLKFVADATTGGWSAAKEYARHGLGAAIVPLPELALDDSDAFVIRRLPERFAVSDHLLRRPPLPDSPDSAVVAALRTAARQTLQEVRERWKILAHVEN